MLGAIGGSLIGAGSAWFGAKKLVDLKVKGLPMGGYQASVGPIKNGNFPYVVMGRFIHLHRQVSSLTHANREALSFEAADFQASVINLEKADQKALHAAVAKLLKQKPIDDFPSLLSQLF